MKEKIKVGVSNHHLHLTKEVYQKLFNRNELTLKANLHQKGEFAANETLTIQCGDKLIENLRIIGPFRTYNQIELSASDARKLRITPPVKRSGDLEGSIPVKLIGPYSTVNLDEGIIIANRHVHFSFEDAQKYHVSDHQKLYIRVSGFKAGIMEAEAKVSSNGFLELHIDTDDASAFLLNSGDEVEVVDKI